VNMARYSVLRLLIFFGFLCALWLVGLREESQRWWLLGLSALGSMVVSFFVLQGPRAAFSASIARRNGAPARRLPPAQKSVVLLPEAMLLPARVQARERVLPTPDRHGPRQPEHSDDDERQSPDSHCATHRLTRYDRGSFQRRGPASSRPKSCSASAAAPS